MKEKKLLAEALQALKENTGLDAIDIQDERRMPDGLVQDFVVTFDKIKTELIVETKKWAAHQNVGALINQYENQTKGAPGLLVADYINDNLGEKLKAAKVNYIDLVGNAFLDVPPVFIYLRGNKNKKTKQTIKGKTFTPTELKMILALLVDMGLLNETYREIADRAKIALGNVGPIFERLKINGYVREEIKTQKRHFENIGELFDRWVDGYPKLRKKYYLGEYVTDERNWWQDADDIAPYEVLFGGEIAGAMYTQLLNPRDGIVYLNKKNQNKLLHRYRFKKIEALEYERPVVTLYEKFWGDLENKRHRLAPELIVYADLIETGDVRNREVANAIKEKHLKHLQ